MRRLVDLPIRYKLMLTTMFTSVVALLIALVAFIIVAIVTGRAALTQKQATVGAVIARNSTAALSFNDPDRATEMLAALADARYVIRAGIYTRDGQLFARYVRDSQPGSLPAQPPADGQRFTGGKLVLATDISMLNRRLGTLVMESDLADLHRQTQLFLLISVLVLAAAIAVAFWLAAALQRVVSRPILALAAIAKAVSEKGDYSVRTTKLSGDELGLLAEAVNEMLRQIETREAALRKSHDELEQRVQERTAQLEVANKELERSNKELEQFAYVASHDLQEPLRKVASFTQLLAERYQDHLDRDAKEFIEYAVDGAKRMQGLINDLLAYSRVGTRGKPFALVDCETVFEYAVANLELAITESGAVLTHDRLPTVTGDDVQLIQLFQNLIGNAIKFRGAALPRVHVSAAKKPNEWLFSVRDNGIGIDPQYFDRIFVIFQRLHSRSEHSGTGIGLAICKKVVERHGGRIWVESEPGKGTTFHFSIPETRRRG